MVTNGGKDTQPAAVLFSAGLDSAVMLAGALRLGPAQPVYVRTGLAWEDEELGAARRLLGARPFAGRTAAMVTLTVDMRDVYPPHHWAVRGDAPGFDTPDEDVYIDGRNIVLLSKVAVFAARAGIRRLLLGPLAGNPFPDATPVFLSAMGEALSLGLASAIEIETPLAAWHKEDVIRRGVELEVPLALTLSCMQPRGGHHCGACSKCRERRDGFVRAGVSDPTQYLRTPPR